MALVHENAAILVADDSALEQLFFVALDLVENPTKLMELSANIMRFAQYNSAERIVDEITKLIHIK